MNNNIQVAIGWVAKSLFYNFVNSKQLIWWLGTHHEI